MILNWQPDCCVGQKHRYLVAVVPASMYVMRKNNHNLTLERIFEHLVNDVNQMVGAF